MPHPRGGAIGNNLKSPHRPIFPKSHVATNMDLLKYILYTELGYVTGILSMFLSRKQ